MKKITRLSAIFTTVVLSLLCVSCNDFEGEQEVPSYLRVEGFTLRENPEIAVPQDSGFLSNEISDVWIYVDNKLIGAFPLPCSVPILQKGVHKVDIRPGVLYNGMQGTREAYPFYTTSIKNINLIEGQEVDFSEAEITYNAQYSQISSLELFEEPYNNFMLTDTSNGQLLRMPMCSDPDSVKNGLGCGAIYYDSNGNNKYIIIDSIYCTNKNGTVLELDYHSNIPFEVGLYGRASSASALTYVSVMRMLANEEKGWKKMYILFNKAWGSLDYPEYYRFYFEAFNPDGVSNPYIHIDNVKLVHYPNQY